MYIFDTNSLIIREWLATAFRQNGQEESQHGRFQTYLRFLWEISDGQWTAEAIRSRMRSEEGAASGSQARISIEYAENIRSAMLRHKPGGSAHREWCARIIPKPSRAHFEVLAFGQRVDRRSQWGGLSNSEADAVLGAVRGTSKLCFTNAERLAEELRRINVRHGYPVARDVAYYFMRRTWAADAGGYYRLSEFGGIHQDAGWSCARRRTRRGTNLEHNAKRFGVWCLRALAPDERSKCSAVWGKSRTEFRESVYALYGREAITAALAGRGDRAPEGPVGQ